MKTLRKGVPRALVASGIVLLTGLVAGPGVTPLFARPFSPTPTLDAFGTGRIVAGDFNGDGRGDLAVANVDNPDSTQSVGLLLGEGGGMYRYSGVVFTSPESFPDAFYGGDFNQDGKPDLLLEAGSGFNHTVFVLLGQGNGSFVPVTPLAVAGPAFLADGNADGRPDLIVPSGSGTTSFLRVWTGSLNGAFTPLAPFPAPAGVDFGMRPLAVGDLNGDHIADVVATNGAGDAAIVLRGAANGTYAVVQTLTGIKPRRASHLADFSGDGASDLILEIEAAGFIVLKAYRGHGDGTFDATHYWQDVAGDATNEAAWVSDISSGDLDGNGARDIATVSLNGVRVLLGGGGTFASSPPLAAGLMPAQALIGDFDGTGARDLAVVHATGVTLVLAGPDGSYRPAPLPQSDVVSAVPRIVTADFTGDGLVDVAALHAQVPPCDDDLPCPWGEVEAWPSLAQGGFGAPGFYPIAVAPIDLRAVDLDRDGKLDLLAVNQGESIASGSLSILRGRGDGTFEAEVRLPLTLRPSAVAAGDFDRDGDTDLAVANVNDSSVSVFLRTPAGSYVAQPLIATGRIPIRIEAVDLDGDGILDLAVADRGKTEPGPIPGDVSWFRGRGNGTFDPVVVLFSGMRLTSDLKVADVNVDGKPDLVVTDEGNTSHELSQPDGAFHVLRNQGLGVFAATSYPEKTFPLQVRAADFNGDGSVDLMTENGTADLRIYPGFGNGAFGPAERFSVMGCRSFEPVRLPGDGDMDLLTSCGNVAQIENEAIPANPILKFAGSLSFRWDPVDLVTGYDVIRGSLPILRSSHGNFGLAVQACVQNDGPLNTVDVTGSSPPVGSGFFYLVRAIGWNGTPGSYDGENPGQAAPRDASIASSASACP